MLRSDHRKLRNNQVKLMWVVCGQTLRLLVNKYCTQYAVFGVPDHILSTLPKKINFIEDNRNK